MFRTAAVASLAAASLLAPPAGADPLGDTRYRGGCSLSTVNERTVTGDDYRGVVRGYAVGYALTARHNPVTVVRLRCVLSVDGVVVGDWSAPGTGPVAVVEPHEVAFSASLLSVVALCTYVDLVDAHGQATTRDDNCGRTTLQAPPQWVINDIDDAFFVVGTVTAETDRTTCAALVALAPAQHEPLVIGPDGDTYVDGELVWSCPPY